VCRLSRLLWGRRKEYRALVVERLAQELSTGAAGELIVG